jgi:hypothetical protein
MGYVVRDIKVAMDHWAKSLGVGPWFYNPHYEFDSFIYRGSRYDELDISVAMANSGEMQIELIQQRCETPRRLSENSAKRQAPTALAEKASRSAHREVRNGQDRKTAREWVALLTLFLSFCCYVA